MSRLRGIWQVAFLAAALWVGAAGLASAQIYSDAFEAEETEAAPSRSGSQVPLPNRRPPPPVRQIDDGDAEKSSQQTKPEAGSLAPGKKTEPEKADTDPHETGAERVALQEESLETGGHEGLFDKEEVAKVEGPPERASPVEDSDPVPEAQATGALPDAAPEAVPASADSAPAAAAPEPEPRKEPVESGARDGEKPNADTPSAHGTPRRSVALPARKPPKPRYDPSAVRKKRKKQPASGGSKTREQQCAALTLCRNAFSKCRFSKDRDKTDEEGWEIHKKYCGDKYNKCITRHFGEGEMFFTRWFLPYDPCS